MAAGATHQSRVRTRRSAPRSRIPTTTQSRTATAPKPPPPAPNLVALRAALSGALNKGGPQTGALVYDLTAKQTLFSVRASVGRPPASVEKLYTTVATLNELGPNARLKTTVVGAGHLGPGGVWHGNLYLVGGGDPTFGDGGFNKTWEQGYGPTASQLVSQLAHDGIKRVTGWVIGDAALFDELRGGPATGYHPDIPDFGGQLSALSYDHGSTYKKLNPGAFAAKELVLTMHGAGIGARPLNRTLPTPDNTRQLASVQSPPLSVMLRLMDVPSDDFFAEMLTKQLGVRFGTGGSITAGAQVISNVIQSFGLHPRIVDGSGLSRDDRSSPDEVVDLLQEDVEHADRPDLVGFDARRRSERNRPKHRRPHRRSGTVHRQDRHAQLRDKPRRLLHRAEPPRARVRADGRRTGQLDRDPAVRSDGPGDRQVLT